MSEEAITVWSTKYALTKGIERVEGRVSENGIFFTYHNGHWHVHLHDSEWHRTPQDAIAQADKVRSKKIESLKNQIKKLETMTFKVDEKGRQ